MTNSSQPKDYSITSSDTITISGESYDFSTLTSVSTDTITLTNIGSFDTSTINWNSSMSYAAGPTYTISSGTPSISTIDIGSISGVFNNAEWESRFPEWDRVQKMCDEYPGLKIAFDKFKTTYKLVKDHYDTPPEKRPK